MATEQQLIVRALSILGIPGAGQPIAAEDADIVRAQIRPKIDELAKRSVVYIGDPTNFDDGYLYWLASLIAQDVANEFGLTADAGAIVLAESRLKEMQFQGQVAVPIKAEYF